MNENDIKVEPIDDIADFDRICHTMSNKLVALGNNDYDVIRKELHQLSAPLSDSPNPDVLSKDLSRIQAFRDRAVEIVRVLTNIYLTHKRVVEILTHGWPKYSIEKSAEKREGEALLKFSNFIMAASDAEAIYRHALGVMKNLESQQENVSRQISCAIVSSKIGQRYANPHDITDWDKFNEPADGQTDAEKQV